MSQSVVSPPFIMIRRDLKDGRSLLITGSPQNGHCSAAVCNADRSIREIKLNFQVGMIVGQHLRMAMRFMATSPFAREEV